ncbi:Ig-like domain-containing protein [Corallococcus exiguus]|uniref:Ig-like domain-containing protein n=1 Tax=Corallococcus exiguus TaxID=83462 RepID=UPI00155F59F6|nr:Ig-like domain-containing protein [Corallococcus exiguus]NRD53446.1 Ig-like domain-containing protein [Corallococcus exiguus]NRD63845.1 Ig-like domain-containing protein [Corallococcus exiguus]
MTLRRHLLVFFVLLQASACIQIPELTPPAPVDGGIEVEPSVSLTWMSPEPDAYTNGPLLIRMDVAGATPEQVELLVDGAPVAQLSPPYELNFETLTLAEGRRVLTARATLGAQVFTSAERGITVDRTRPRMLVQSPASGADQVPVGTAIHVTFSEPLLKGTVTDKSVLTSSYPLNVIMNAELSDDGTSISIVPLTPIPANETMMVVVSRQVTDLAGNSVEPPQQPWTWTVPSYLLVGEPLFAGRIEESNISETFIRVDQDSHPVVAWTQDVNAHVKRWDGERWEYLGAPLSAGTNNLLWKSALQMDVEGRPLLASLEYEGPKDQIQLRRWTGTAWETLGTPLTTTLSQGRIRWMGLSSGARSPPLVAWYEDNSTQAQIVLRQWDGSQWTTTGSPLPMTKGAVNNYLGFDLDALGRPVFSFCELISGMPEVGHVMRWTGSSWADLSSGLAGLPTARAVTADGTVLVGMKALVNGAWRSLVRKWDGSTWIAVGEPLDTIFSGMDRVIASIALDSQQRPVVFASEALSSTDASMRTGQVRRWAGGLWKSVGEPLRAGTGKATWGVPSFVLPADDEPLISWTERIHPAEFTMTSVHVHRLNK